jgi:hypothetical protein
MDENSHGLELLERNILHHFYRPMTVVRKCGVGLDRTRSVIHVYSVR